MTGLLGTLSFLFVSFFTYFGKVIGGDNFNRIKNAET